jgi:hypothetical protein
MPNTQIIRPGEKFAVIGFRTICVRQPQPLSLAPGLWASDRLPFTLDDNWRQWIGSVRERAMRDANLFLIATMPSAQITDLDHENERLKAQVHRLYQALLVSASVRVFDTVFLLTGAYRDGGPALRQLMEPPAPLSIPGTDAHEVGPTVLRTAAGLVAAIADLEAIGGFKRIGRVYGIFQRALQNPDHVERFHQFCRCIEGFILPDISRTTRQFQSRTELFIGGQHHAMMRRLYEMRSQVEHLHQVSFDDWPRDERERRLILLRESSFIEELARRCIAHFLQRRELWPHYVDDAALSQFWSADNVGTRRTAWGPPFNLNELRRRFHDERISNADLAL